MAAKVTLLQFVSATSTGNQAITHGHGATPEAAIFFYSKATALETARTHAHQGVGFSDGTINRVLCGRSLDAEATSIARIKSVNGCIVWLKDSGAGSAGTAATCSFGATSITLNWTTAPVGAYYVCCVLFSGLEAAKVIEQVQNGTTAQSITHSLGLTTTNHALIFGLTSHRIAAAWETETNDWGTTFGVAHWNGSAFAAQKSHGFMEDAGEADGRPAVYLDTSNFFRVLTSTYALEYSSSLSNYLTNSFDITGSAAAATDDSVYLIIGLPSDTEAYLGDLSMPTATGSKEYSPLSWTPQHVGSVVTNIETQNSLRQNLDGDEAGAFGYSLIDSSGGAACSASIENDAATTNTESNASDEAIYMPADNGTLTASAAAGNGCRATFTSLDADGWTIGVVGANSTQTYGFAWAVQGTAAAGGDVSTVLDGAAGAAQVGALAASGGVLTIPVGAGGTGQVGTLGTVTGALSVLLGVEGTGQVGTLGTVTGALSALLGVEGTGQVGDLLTGSITIVELAGASGSGQVGDLSILSGALVGLASADGTGQVGVLDLITGAVVGLTGADGLGQVGDLAAGSFTVVALTGVSGSGEVGSLDVTTGAAVSLTGVDGTGSIGNFDVSAGLSLTLAGVSASGVVGTLVIEVGDFVLSTPDFRIYTIREEDRTLLVVH